MLGYLAGVIDGEGCIHVSSAFGPKSINVSHNIRVTVVNTDERLMDWLLLAVGGSVGRRGGTSSKPHWKPRFAWSVYAQNAAALLEALLPYLLLKREQAELVLALRRLGGGSGPSLDAELVQKRIELAQRIGELNQKGAVA